ncbi:MAG: RNA polymerase sigma factor [Lewinellaceae bacterium]|nr:RNA polymerase sigma factor [Lewinellaceae bacterium]
MSEPDLKKLLKACQRGELRAQRSLYERHCQSLFAVCQRYARDRPEAQDMLQDSFLTIYRDLHQYKFEGAFEAWLQKVTVRTALQHLRRKNPLRFAAEISEIPRDHWNVQPDAELNQEAILGMVRKLPPGYRTVFNLRCIEAYSYTEIAENLGITESAVRSQYTRACSQLRRMLSGLFTGIY